MSHHATSPIIFTHPAPSTATIGEAVHSHLSFAMRQEDEEIPLEDLSRSEEHTSELSHVVTSRMPSSA